MENEISSPTGQIYVWYSEFASIDEKADWRSTKKLIILGNSERALYEIHTADELKSLLQDLRQQGWVEQIMSPHLTRWIKADEIAE